MQTRNLTILFSLILFTLLTGCSKAVENPIPERIGFVNDYAQVFSEEEKSALIATLEKYEKETCHQILVLTVPSLNGETIGNFSARTAKSWDIGQDLLDNGVLITLAMEEGSVRIEANSGLEFLVKDGIGDQVLAQDMIPLFKEKKIVEGIHKGVFSLMEAARVKTYPDDHSPMICL